MDSGKADDEQPRSSSLDLGQAAKAKSITLTSNPDSPQSPTPIYWQHRRYESYASIGNNKPAPIILEDNTEDTSDIKSPLWAKHVTIDGHVIVTGSMAGVGDYTVWNVRIDTLDVSISKNSSSSPSSITLFASSLGRFNETNLCTGRRDDTQEEVSHTVHASKSPPLTSMFRYSDFNDLRKKLAMTFPNSKAAMPTLPPKSTFCEQRPFPILILSKTRSRQISPRVSGEATSWSCLFSELRLT